MTAAITKFLGIRYQWLVYSTSGRLKKETVPGMRVPRCLTIIVRLLKNEQCKILDALVFIIKRRTGRRKLAHWLTLNMNTDLVRVYPTGGSTFSTVH